MYTKTGTKVRGKVIHSHDVDGEARHRKKSILLMSERLTVLCVCARGVEIKTYLCFHYIFLGQLVLSACFHVVLVQVCFF